MRDESLWLAVAALVALSVSFLFSLSVLTAFFWSSYKGVRDAQADLYGHLRRRLRADCTVMAELAAYPPPSLAFVAERLRHELTQERTRFAFIFGAVEKVGMIPSALALLYGTVQEDQAWRWIAVGTMLLYLGVQVVSQTLAKAERQLSLIDHTLNIQTETSGDNAATESESRSSVRRS